ncbi:carboxypeptidase M32 [Bacillaceae bacterium Marseille-Q3522]|nr:carboxypeptidase M32 [Bacillaceae bacterium Marseille-Q3522]
MSTKEIEEQFLKLVKKITAYNEATSVIYWDMRTGAPKNGINQRSEVVGMLSEEIFRLSTSEEMGTYITKLLQEKDTLSPIVLKTVEECQKEYERMKKIPGEEYKEYVILQAKAEHVWEEAKETANFEQFRPYLEKLVETNKKFISYWGYDGNKYNTLLDIYEPGMTVEILDNVFAKLREKIVPLVAKIKESTNQPRTDFVYHPFLQDKQREVSLKVLQQMGYNFDSGRLDVTVHPFTIGLNPGDVRVTTKYVENDFRIALFGTIHEGGHALYEQNISQDLIGTPLCTGTSMGIHESQSLFYENFIGRNLSFWKKNYPLLKQAANSQFDDVSVEEFYRGINESKPSLIRTEADELTYPLHIMIRYEIEKGLFNDEIKVADLPKIWNEKYQEYLGVTPENDGVGVLQDVHWAGGSFGYFPSYALGYMYAAQFKAALLKDFPNFDELLAAGTLLPIREWFTKHVHKYGKMKKPLEILKETTGEGLNVQYLIQYLEEKYSEIYKLS